VEKLAFTRQVRDQIEERILYWLREREIQPAPQLPDQRAT
jgi:hypothetical protein